MYIQEKTIQDEQLSFIDFFSKVTFWTDYSGILSFSVLKNHFRAKVHKRDFEGHEQRFRQHKLSELLLTPILSQQSLVSESEDSESLKSESYDPHIFAFNLAGGFSIFQSFLKEISC